ncbi:unnamed protein product, partial [Mesorhabditis belari]|uniref:Membrane insertase YidC/Oxa/ALB C-terminal domain-containing protein n=2 Tax=Mesorhabditis belari TaxID=2138241 RepID=A0AAF3J8F4_9BILA
MGYYYSIYGESVLQELGLWSWWKPSSYFRWALESIHVHLDVPWWSAIVCTTILLRLALIGVPIMSQKLVAKQSKYKKELDAFRNRIEDARREGDNLAIHQILLEQRDFYKAKDIKMGRQLGIMLVNGGIFMTQFLAIRKMAAVSYPGFSTGGALWFTDLTSCDPYWALPVISAATMAMVMRVGIESGASADQMTPWMRLGMQYGLPVIILISSSQFASGLCVYWCASNIVSLFYAGFFKVPAVRKMLNIPDVVKTDSTRASALSEVWKGYKNKKQVQPSLSDLRIEDAKRFKKAGQGKPRV